MKVVVYGMMRSGTTLLCDLLTVPGRSLVFSEPMPLTRWNDDRAKDIQAVARGFGLPVGDAPPREADFGSMAAYIERVLEPRMTDLDFWGFKEVHLDQWQPILDRYRPERLIVCVRDIRAIALSALDLVGGSLLAFTGIRRLRDEAWLLARLSYDVDQLRRLRERPHLLIRYEDLVSDERVTAELAGFVGLDRLGTGDLHRRLNTSGTRQQEVEKHGQGISQRTRDRFAVERNPIARAFAEHIARTLGDYQAEFGYAGPDAPPDAAMPPRPAMPWLEVMNWRSTGPMSFDPAFARRRARMLVAGTLPSGSRVLDLGCLLPVLKYMLPDGCRYQGLDDTAGRQFVATADWRRGELPGHEAATHLTLLGSFEFVEDVKSLLSALRATGKEVLLSFHPADETRELDRESFGWRNHLTRAELLAAFKALGFRAAEQHAFDGYQSLYRLQPAKTD